MLWLRCARDRIASSLVECVRSAEAGEGGEKPRQTGADSKMERDYGAKQDPVRRRLECS